jgi:hypothetical protein
LKYNFLLVLKVASVFVQILRMKRMVISFGGPNTLLHKTLSQLETWNIRHGLVPEDLSFTFSIVFPFSETRFHTLILFQVKKLLP